MSSEESYDPEDDIKRKEDKIRKKATRKMLRKRKRGGPAARARDVALKQQRRNRGEIDRTHEAQRFTKKRRACVKSRESELNKQKDGRANDSDPSDFSI